MALVTDTRPLPASLDGRPKQLLIDGEWVTARSGKVFDS